MKGYLVIKAGVYRHEVWGIRYEVEAAKAFAQEMLSGEPDDYHSAEIVEIDLDEESPSASEHSLGAVHRNDTYEGGSRYTADKLPSKITATQFVWVADTRWPARCTKEMT